MATAATYRGEVVVIGGGSDGLANASNKVFALRGGSRVELPSLAQARRPRPRRLSATSSWWSAGRTRSSSRRPSGAPITLGRGTTHVVTYADILRDLEPLNEGRDKSDRITYDSLWVHAKRHYDLAATTAYWRARMYKELINALGG